MREACDVSRAWRHRSVKSALVISAPGPRVAVRRGRGVAPWLGGLAVPRTMSRANIKKSIAKAKKESSK